MLSAEDQKDREVGCFLYCLDCAQEEVKKGSLLKAEAFMNNAFRSLYELHKMIDTQQKERELNFMVAKYQEPTKQLVNQYQNKINY